MESCSHFPILPQKVKIFISILPKGSNLFVHSLPPVAPNFKSSLYEIHLKFGQKTYAFSLKYLCHSGELNRAETKREQQRKRQRKRKGEKVKLKNTCNLKKLSLTFFRQLWFCLLFVVVACCCCSCCCLCFVRHAFECTSVSGVWRCHLKCNRETISQKLFSPTVCM